MLTENGIRNKLPNWSFFQQSRNLFSYSFITQESMAACFFAAHRAVFSQCIKIINQFAITWAGPALCSPEPRFQPRWCSSRTNAWLVLRGQARLWAVLGHGLDMPALCKLENPTSNWQVNVACCCSRMKPWTAKNQLDSFIKSRIAIEWPAW